MFDMLQAHYDLAISVALWWLEKKEGRHVLDREIMYVFCFLKLNVLSLIRLNYVYYAHKI